MSQASEDRAKAFELRGFPPEKTARFAAQTKTEIMKINRPAPLTAIVLVGLILLSLIPVYGQKAGTRAATERALRAVDAEWAAAAQAKDFDKVISYYSATAIELPPNAPARRTREAITKSWQELFQTPGATLNWHPTKVEVSESRDLGYIAGIYEYTSTDAAGNKIVDRGKYLEVMRKIDDGTWKCVGRELELRSPRAQTEKIADYRRPVASALPAESPIVGRASCPPSAIPGAARIARPTRPLPLRVAEPNCNPHAKARGSKPSTRRRPKTPTFPPLPSPRRPTSTRTAPSAASTSCVAAAVARKAATTVPTATSLPTPNCSVGCVSRMIANCRAGIQTAVVAGIADPQL